MARLQFILHSAIHSHSYGKLIEYTLAVALPLQHHLHKNYSTRVYPARYLLKIKGILFYIISIIELMAIVVIAKLKMMAAEA